MKWLWAIALVCTARLPGSDIQDVRRLIDKGQVREALQEIEELRRNHATDPTLQLEIGELLQELAASRAQRLEQVAPDSAQAHELVGKSKEAHQKLAEALAEYRLAADKSPQLSGVHFLIGNVYWKLGELPEAKTALEQELALHPDHSLANLRLGQVLLRMDENNPLAAIVYLRKAISNPETGLAAHRDLGKALRLAGHPKEAIQELKLVEQRLPEDNMIHAQLAAAYRAMGDGNAARREMELHNKIVQQEHERTVELHQSQTDN